MIKLLGFGVTSDSVTLTTDEFRSIHKLYGFKPEKPDSNPSAPEPSRQGSTHPIMQAGADRNSIRHAESDGLRMVGWIAKFLPEGEDPVKALIQLAVDAGWDVDPEDVTWVEGE
jgi:hypothetical protein